ncbi:putative Copper transport protein [Seiridium unicorne]|uniref:Copper transport protein n=1 Tax=Seiridium unicorne TaxID=138068 RepID=A0ABR2V5T3_9PEZI
MEHAHMDHSQMDHGGMDHGNTGHGGHGGMTDMCNMNMLFTWDPTNLCIIFRGWHIRGTASLIFSLLAIVAIGVGYEALREATRRYEAWVNQRQETAPRQLLMGQRAAPAFAWNFISQYNERKATELWLRESARAFQVIASDHEDGHLTETTPFLWSGRNQIEVSKRAHIIKALLYAVQSFYAFMMMLLFMTYNGWVMLAVFVGNFVGYIMFGTSTKATKDNACH